jgi:hypothetical protein
MKWQVNYISNPSLHAIEKKALPEPQFAICFFDVLDVEMRDKFGIGSKYIVKQ